MNQNIWRIFSRFFLVRFGDVRFYSVFAVPIDTHTGSIVVINVPSDIRLQWTKVSQSIEFDERNQSSKYETTSKALFLYTKCAFGSFYSNFFFTSESPDDLDASLQKNNDSHVSGISPFFSSEDMNVSLSNTPQYNESESVSKWNTIVKSKSDTYFYYKECQNKTKQM